MEYADVSSPAAVLTWHSNAGVRRRGAGDAAGGGAVDDQHDLAGIGVQGVGDCRLADHDHPVDAGGALVAHAELLCIAHLQAGANQALYLTCGSPPATEMCLQHSAWRNSVTLGSTGIALLRPLL